MKTVELGADAVYFVPETYAEASEKQRLAFAMASIVPLEKRDRAFWEYVVMHGLGCSAKFWRRFVFSVDQWLWLCRLFEWIFTAKCSVRPCAHFDLGGVRYFLPAEGLNDTDAIDFSMAAVWFAEMADSEHNVEALHKLMGVLCRPQRGDLDIFRASDAWDGDVREVFNDYRALERAKVFADADVGLKVAFLHWWEKEFSDFVEGYKDLFGKGDDVPRYGDGRGWVMVLKHVAQKGYLGALDSVHTKNVHEVWSYMMDDAMDVKERTSNP